MYQALYRSFRPETFDAVLGQEHIVKILKNQIRSGTTGHAYLFCGTRGTGKTTTARLLAKGVNCLAPEEDRPCGVCENCKSIKEGTFMDVVEIDAASNNGVENIRELRESVKYPPVAGRCKVYIIDEVHMLSTGAFNALLKTLEEPPENVMFILATTEVQKLPATILSRCLRLDFHRVPEVQLKKGMKEICREVGVEISDSALGLIAANADGSVRDGLSLLDQCISGGEKQVSREDVLTLLGAVGEEIFIEMTDLVCQQKVGEALLLLDQALSQGKDVRQFIRDWISHFRALLMTKFIREPEDLLNMSAENVDRIRTQSQRVDLRTLNDYILELSKTLSDAKWSTQPRVLLELVIVRMAAGGSGGPGRQDRWEEPAPGRGLKQEVGQGPYGGSVQEQQKTPDQRPNPEAALQPLLEQGRVLEEGPVPDPEREPERNLEELWRGIFEDGETLKGSFHLLSRGTFLTEIGEEFFVVEVGNDTLEKFAKDNRSQIETLMEKRLGKKLRMTVRLRQGEKKSGQDQAEQLALSMGRRLGINIEVE